MTGNHLKNIKGCQCLFLLGCLQRILSEDRQWPEMRQRWPEDRRWPENQRYPEFPQDMGKICSHWVGSDWGQKIVLCGRSVEKKDIGAKNAVFLPKIHFLAMSSIFFCNQHHGTPKRKDFCVELGRIAQVIKKMTQSGNYGETAVFAFGRKAKNGPKIRFSL